MAFAQHIVITRAAHQYRELAEKVRAEESVPLSYPAIALAPPAQTAPLDSALHSIAFGVFDWLVFTSANTAHSLGARLRAIGVGWLPVRIAAIGAGTAAAVSASLHRRPDVVPDHATTDALIDALPLRPGAHVLLPQSELADGALVTGLMKRGARVTAVQAYRVVTGGGGVDLPRLLPRDPERYILTFTSSSTVNHFVLRYTREGGSLDEVRASSLVIMGASTARALEAHLLSPTAHAPENDLNALMRTIKGLIHA